MTYDVDNLLKNITTLISASNSINSVLLGTTKILYKTFVRDIEIISLHIYNSEKNSYVKVFKKSVPSQTEIYATKYPVLMGANVINILIKNHLSYPKFIAFISIKFTKDYSSTYSGEFKYIEDMLYQTHRRCLMALKIYPQQVNFLREKPFFYEMLEEIQNFLIADVAYTVAWYDENKKLKIFAELAGKKYADNHTRKSPNVNLAINVNPIFVEEILLKSRDGIAITLSNLFAKDQYDWKNFLNYHNYTISSVLLKSFIMSDEVPRILFEGATYKYDPYKAAGFIMLARSSLPSFSKEDSVFLNNATDRIISFLKEGLKIRREFNSLGYVNKLFMHDSDVYSTAENIISILNTQSKDYHIGPDKAVSNSESYILISNDHGNTPEWLELILSDPNFLEVINNSYEDIFFITNAELCKDDIVFGRICAQLLEYSFKSIIVCRIGKDAGFLITINKKAYHFSFFDKFKYRLFSDLIAQAIKLQEKYDIGKSGDLYLEEMHYVKSIKEIFIFAIERVLTKTQSSYADIYTYDKSRETLILSHSSSENNTYKELKLGEGLVGVAAKQLKSIIENDVTMNKDYIKLRGDTTAEIAIPIMHNGQLFGILNVEKNAGHYTLDNVATLHNITNHMLVAYKNYKVSNMYSDILSDLREDINNIIEYELDTDIAFQKCATLIVKAVGAAETFAHSAVIRLEKIIDGVLVLKRLAFAGSSPELKHDEIMMVDGGVNVWVYQNKRHCYLYDINIIDRYEGLSYLPVRKKTKSELCLPVRNGMSVVGTFNIENDRFGGLSQDLPYYFSLGDILSSSYERLTMKKKLNLLRNVVSTTINAILHDMQKNDLQVLLSNLAKLYDEYDVKRLDIMKNTLESITSEINGITKARNIEKKDNIDLVTIFEDILKEIKEDKAIQGNIDFLIKNTLADNEHPTVEANSKLIKTALRNILTNSKMHGGNSLEIEYKRLENNKFLIILRDNGNGIPPEYINNLYKSPIRKSGREDFCRGALIAANYLEIFENSIIIDPNLPNIQYLIFSANWGE